MKSFNIYVKSSEPAPSTFVIKHAEASPALASLLDNGVGISSFAFSAMACHCGMVEPKETADRLEGGLLFLWIVFYG
ncbi:hypothetical protein D3C74_445140 [compost metagenome]